MEDLLYPPHNKTVGGILVSLCLTVRPSINWDVGRSVVFSEDQLHWRQSTGIDGNYRSRKITARRWLHKYVGGECGASSFTWYLYQICNKDVCATNHTCSVVPTVLVGSISYLYMLSSNFRRCVACKVSCKIWIFGNFLKFVTLFCFDLGIWWESLVWVIMGRWGYLRMQAC